jgi:hypothetical protein
MKVGHGLCSEESILLDFDAIVAIDITIVNRLERGEMINWKSRSPKNLRYTYRRACSR